MSNEIREAAKRLRWCDRTLHLDYVGTDQEQLDILTLANAYLAEHQEDDDEPVADEWLRSIGADNQVCLNMNGGFSLVFYQNLNPSIEGDEGGLIELPDCNTRGDVRRLMSALGLSNYPQRS